MLTLQQKYRLSLETLNKNLRYQVTRLYPICQNTRLECQSHLMSHDNLKKISAIIVDLKY
jgi:hypothetical protein